MAQEEPSITFGCIADLQYCDADPEMNRYFRRSPEKLKGFMAEMNQHNLDFVVNLGDTIDHNFESFDVILPKFKNLRVPLHHVLGNHDYEVEDQFKSRVHEKMGTDKYYQFQIDSWRFIVLDGNEISTFANVKDSKNFNKAEQMLRDMELQQKINANFWNGAIGDEQWIWLEKMLKESELENEKVILFCHYPVYPEYKHNLLNSDQMLDLLKDYSCVKAWINGHNHRGNFGSLHDILFINMKGIVEGEYDFAYSIVQLFEHKLKVCGFGSEISATLTF